MKSLVAIVSLFIAAPLVVTAQDSQDYFPAPSEWQRMSPESQDYSTDKAQRAIDYALASEYSGDSDLRVAILKGFSHEPFHEIKGPTKKRGGPAGMIIKNGYIIAEWGDLDRVDMTFSVTKSYLSTLGGVALAENLINDIDEPVAQFVWDGTFAGRHNSKITWRHLLEQTSDWQGELFGIKDWADRPPREGDLDDWQFRELREPGTVMEYNDVRVNVLAYSLLQVFRQPLPQVLKQHIMDPIGASPTWRWFGYNDAWVNVDGIKMNSVTGGGHSGAGAFVSTLDQARFGLLFTRNGRWQSEQIISPDWIKTATTPSAAHASYGLMWWVNQGPRKWQDVDNEDLFYAAGFGGNFIVVDQQNDLMLVTRWLEPSKINDMAAIVFN